MIKLNEEYSINRGQGTIVFTEGNKGNVNAEYEIKGNKGKGEINGTLENEILKATFHLDAATGLIEFTFHENGFDAKWKSGLEPGSMRGKWVGIIENNSTSNNTQLSDEQKRYLEEGISLGDFDKEYQGDSEGKIAWMKEKSFVLEAIKQDERILKFASEELKADREVVTLALKQNISAIHYADEKLKYDPQLLIARIIVHFEGEENISITDEDLIAFIEKADTAINIEKLLFKVEYILLKHKKEEFQNFNKKIISFVNAHHDCFWILQAISVCIENVEAKASWYKENPDHYKNVCELVKSFNLELSFEPSIEFETYFNDAEINSSWDDCKWIDNQNYEEGEGLCFSEFIMDKTGMKWENETWYDVKFYNQAISRAWVGIINYSLRHVREGFDEENVAVCLHSIVQECYVPIKDSGFAEYGINTFIIIAEYLLDIPENDYDLNETDRNDLEGFSDWQFDLNKVANNICNRDLFECEFPIATEFTKKNKG